jgi:hypothetical protein
VWQQAVTQLASVGSLTIIDVSEPSENLLWEIEELAGRLGPRCVFVAHHERIARLTERSADATPADPLAARLLRCLDGREVLAYDTDPAATRRFARALQAKLLDVAGAGLARPPMSSAAAVSARPAAGNADADVG